MDASALERLFGATRHRHSVFFTGGDQVKITSQIGDTPIFNRIREIYDDGGVIAGTSAGAAVMSETMLVIGGDEQSHVKTLSIYNVRLHMLSQGDRFDLFTRAPRQMKGRAAEKLPEKEEEPSPQPT